MQPNKFFNHHLGKPVLSLNVWGDRKIIAKEFTLTVKAGYSGPPLLRLVMQWVFREKKGGL
jgi:hypothetical protein